MGFPSGTHLTFAPGKAMSCHARHIPWLRPMEDTLYWGDCNRHGFAILNGVRETLLQMRAILMCISSVDPRQANCTMESDAQRVSAQLLDPTKGEQSLRQALSETQHRIEQESLYGAGLGFLSKIAYIHPRK